MHKGRKLLALLLALVLVGAVLGIAGCKSKSTGGTKATFTTIQSGKILVGSETSFPPFEFLEGTEIAGFDVDLMAAIAKELGVTSEFMSEGFDTLIPTLKAGGKFDVIGSGMTITDERKQEIDFSDPYIDANLSVAMRTGDTYTDPATLSGKKVGCQAGSTGLDWANENLKPAGASIVEFKTSTDALNALKASNVDAVVNDLPVTAYLIKAAGGAMEIVKEIATGDQYGFGVSKDNPELLKAINDALAALKANGEYDKVYQQWFGKE